MEGYEMRGIDGHVIETDDMSILETERVFCECEQRMHQARGGMIGLAHFEVQE